MTMSDIQQDPICNSPVLNSTLFPIGSSLGQNYDIMPFLCQLAGIATNPNVDPTLVAPQPFDNSLYLNFTSLSGVGDPRFSHFAVLSSTFVKFLPKMVTQVEVQRAGGVKVVNGFICDADGNQKVQANLSPATTTVGSGGINLYGFDIPSGLDFNDLMSPITTGAVFDHIDEYIQQQSELHADAFIQYLITYFPSNLFTCSLYASTIRPTFYVSLASPHGNVYLSYYPDIQNYVLQQMINLNYVPIGTTIKITPTPYIVNNAIAAALNTPIPNYLQLVTNSDAATNAATNAVDNFSADPSKNRKHITEYTTSQLSAANV
jgi:hypothetical protein